MLSRVWWSLVRFGFRLLYNEFAFTYDLVSRIVSLGAWRCWQRTVFKFLAAPEHAGVILDLAHGTGNLQIDLHSAGYHTVGYDLSPYMGRIAAGKLKKWSIASNLIRGKAQGLPFAANSIWAVVSTFPTNFIVEADTLKEVHRILQEDGQFIVVLNGKFTGGGAIKGFLEWLYSITGQRDDTSQAGEFLQFIRQFGFDVELKEKRCPHSIVQIMVARKIAVNN